MRGDFKIDGVWYKSYQGLPTQSLANQMASKVGQGTSEYGDLTSWSAWIQEDWQDGVGRLKPHRNGGFLYGEAESRVPGQLVLPQYLRQIDKADWSLLGNPTYTIDDRKYMPANFANTTTVGAGGYVRAAIPFRVLDAATFSDTTHNDYWLYARVNSGVEITAEIWSNSGGAPSASLVSTTYTAAIDTKGFYWRPFKIANAALSSATQYWLVFYPTSALNSFEIAYNVASPSDESKFYNGSAWSSALGEANIIYTSNLNPLGDTDSFGGMGFFRFNGNLYCYSQIEILKYDTADDLWEFVVFLNNEGTTGATVFGDLVYLGDYGDPTGYDTFTTAEAISAVAQNAKYFAKHNGFLWRAYLNTVEYTSDGTTWEPTATFGDPITVSDTSDPITGMCGMGENMYVSTQQGLVCIYPGDVAKGVIPWASLASDNGQTMVNFEGALYITVNGRVVRYTEDGSLQDVWMSRDDDLLVERVGKVVHLAAMNNWLVALVAGDTSAISPTVWAFQGSAWHYMAMLPASGFTNSAARDYSLYYDRTTQNLWISTPSRVTYRIHIPDTTINPYNDTESVYLRNAWVEWDWFDSPIAEAPKDYDSVTIMGENFGSGQYVEVYWKDDASTGWELLGTADSNNEELRWTIGGGTRPNTKRFKLGLLLVTTSGSETPRIRAIRVKYHLMVSDWFRWSVAVDVSGRTGHLQRMTDGDVHTLTAAQIKANLDAVVKTVPPVVYQDVDSQQYEVKIVDANFSYTKHEYLENSATEYWEGVYRIVLEQVTTGTYSA